MTHASIYLDYAAATPLDPHALEAMRPYLTEKFYNPSAGYLAAREVSHDIADARRRIAHWLGSRPGEIIFTAGGSEANNLAIHGIMQQYPKANVVVSAIEHESVLAPAGRYDCRQAGVDSDGVIDLTALEKQINDNTVLVSVMYANNEIGTIQPLREVAALVEKIRRARQRKSVGSNRQADTYPLLLHTDACQAGNYLDLHTTRLGVDLLTLNAGKIYGPKQCGALYMRTGVKLQPQILGGGQERGQRSGTENVANIVGLAEALDRSQQQRQEESRRLRALQKLFFERLESALPDVQINGSRKSRLPNNVHITIPGEDNERLMMALDEAGILCATGSACSASREEPSHVLSAIGLSDENVRSSLRFTMGRDTDEAAVRRTVEILSSLV